MRISRKILLGLLQAAGLVVYCGAVATLMLNLGAIFGKQPGLFGIVFFLMLFVVSAVISGAIVLGYPAYLALSGRFKEGAQLVAWTVGWMLALLVLVGVAFGIAG